MLLLIATVALAVACGAALEQVSEEPDGGPPAAAPSAPVEMQKFAFLQGAWICDGAWRREAGSTQEFRATWSTREALDGHVLLEEYRAFWLDGETFVYGTNFRTFDAVSGRWITRWQSALDGSGFELGQPDFSVDAEGRQVVTFVNGEGEALQRAIYRVLGPDRFVWQGDSSEDGGGSWDEAVMVIDCSRR